MLCLRQEKVKVHNLSQLPCTATNIDHHCYHRYQEGCEFNGSSGIATVMTYIQAHPDVVRKGFKKVSQLLET